MTKSKILNRVIVKPYPYKFNVPKEAFYQITATIDLMGQDNPIVITKIVKASNAEEAFDMVVELAKNESERFYPKKGVWSD